MFCCVSNLNLIFLNFIVQEEGVLTTKVDIRKMQLMLNKKFRASRFHQRNCNETNIVRAGTNIGFRKPANQSTTVRGGNANHGNDGDFSTEHDGKRCTETQSEPSPWWRVDLLKPYSVKIVRVTTRGCCGKFPPVHRRTLSYSRIREA